MRISTAAAIALAEEIKRRAQGPDHMAFDAVTVAGLGPDSGGHGAPPARTSSRWRSSPSTAPAGSRSAP